MKRPPRFLTKLLKQVGMGNWLGFSLLALGLWGVWGFLGKVAAQHLPSKLVFLLTMTGCLAAAGYSLVGGVG